MQRQITTLERSLTFVAASDGELELPLVGVIKSIGIRVDGTYTESTAVEDARLAQKLLRSIRVQDGDKIYYSPKGIDQFKLQNYKNRGNTRFLNNTTAKTFSAFYLLDTGLIIADEKLLPEGYGNRPDRHPMLPVKALSLIATWAALADLFSTVGDVNLGTTTLRVEIEQLIMTKAEIAAFFGPNLEKYAPPKVGARQFDNLGSSTDFTTDGNIGTDTLIKRALLVTHNSSGVEVDTTITRFAIVKTKPVEQALITSRWDTAQDKNNADDEMGAPLAGVVHVDFARKVSGDGIGYPGQGTSDSLQIRSIKGAAGQVRWITEEYIPHPAARAGQVTPILTL